MKSDLIERVARAIEKATDEANQRFGLFDYSSYGWEKPCRVRDYTLENQNLFMGDDGDAARAFYDKTIRGFIAQAAIRETIKAIAEDVTDEAIVAALRAFGQEQRTRGGALYTAWRNSIAAAIASLVKG